jgi:hypothetical protein
MAMQIIATLAGSIIAPLLAIFIPLLALVVIVLVVATRRGR